MNWVFLHLKPLEISPMLQFQKKFLSINFNKILSKFFKYNLSLVILYKNYFCIDSAYPLGDF